LVRKKHHLHRTQLPLKESLNKNPPLRSPLLVPSTKNPSTVKRMEMLMDQETAGWTKKAHQFAQRKQDEIDKADAAIDRLLATKEKIPPPRVMHDKSELYQADIFLPQVTIIAGNALLIEEATVHFSKGRKYGMIGRNGTGKTTLINAICRKEIDKMP